MAPMHWRVPGLSALQLNSIRRFRLRSHSRALTVSLGRSVAGLVGKRKGEMDVAWPSVLSSVQCSMLA